MGYPSRGGTGTQFVPPHNYSGRIPLEGAAMVDVIVGWLGGEARTVAFAIASGVAGFLAKGTYDLVAARRKDRLERVNQQLKLLYGPLYALNQAGNLAWMAFRTK